jgi:hypothetical protein
MKKIKLTKNQYALVDDEDYSYLNKFNWYAKWGDGPKTYYVVRHATINHKTLTVFMHRIIVQCPDNMVVDHINHNGLDNRKSNLRICTSSQNSSNSRIRTDGLSKYKGVSLSKKNNKWQAKIGYKNTIIWLKYHDTEEEAGVAYNKKAKELFGEFAHLNKIKEVSNEKNVSSVRRSA